MTGTWAPALERVLRRTEITSECWIFRGGGARGYGQVRDNVGVMRPAHRIVYEAAFGPVDPELHLDHLCRNRKCVRPTHLEPVTLTENIARGIVGAFNRGKTHCPNGHEYTEKNTAIYTTKAGYRTRTCKTCKSVRQARSRKAGSR